MKKRVRNPTAENHIKDALKIMLTEIGAHHFAASAGSFTTGGISDRIICYRGMFIACEVKRPGRRGEQNGGLSALQKQFGKDVMKAGGYFFKVDDYNSIDAMRCYMENL
jgi:hypothetical protein